MNLTDTLIIKAQQNFRVILIGGPSFAGKSTLAHYLSLKLGWCHKLTDKLARHPGRPWRTKTHTVPEHVGEHYLSLSIDELLENVLRHYKMNVWPDAKAIVTSHSTDVSTDKIIMEGSALWPESVVTLDFQNVAAIWLTAENDFIERKIHDASQYVTLSPHEKTIVDKFLWRNQLYNERMMDAINRLGLLSIDVEASSSMDELSDKALGYII